jgi:hypothetical protein
MLYSILESFILHTKYKLNTINTLSAAEKVSGNILINTVKPVFNGHPWGPPKSGHCTLVVSLYRFFQSKLISKLG